MIHAALLAALLASEIPDAPVPLPLPGGEGGIGLDDLTFSEPLHRLLVAAGRTGRVDLVDPASGAVDSVEGFTRSGATRAGHAEGTTSADAGRGLVFAIDRGDRIVAVVDPGARRVVARARLAGGPDYVRWVEPAGEVWVTEPGRQAIETFRLEEGQAPALARTGVIAVPGGPESLVVDAARGRAYTNTFRDATIAIDVRAHAVVARWENGCRGARGIALDPAHGWVFVGCDEGKAVALDPAAAGKVLGAVRTGDGVDGIAYASRLGHLYVPAGDAATLSIVGVGARGDLLPIATVPTARDAHCAVADDRANVYVCDPRKGRLLVVRDPHPPSPAATAIVPSPDFPRGTATPSVECGVCHQAIYREYAEGFGSDMSYAGVGGRGRGDAALRMPAGASVAASAHAVAGTDPWPIHAREAEEEGKRCNVCHFPQPFAIPDRAAVELAKPAPREEAQGEGITCAACHLTPQGTIRGPHRVEAPHATVADERMESSEMCAYCHALGKRVPGKQTQTYLEWRDDFAAQGLGRQQCQDCHMPRTARRTAEGVDVPVRAVARHLWTGGHSGQRLGSALSLVLLQPEKDRAVVELHVINVGAGHSVPTGSNRRAVHLHARVLDGRGKVLATRDWMFAPWYGPRPDDRAFLAEDEKRPDRIAATQADEQGPHEAPVRAGEERILTWQPELHPGRYSIEVSVVYDLNRYDDPSFTGDQRELSRVALPFPVGARP